MVTRGLGIPCIVGCEDLSIDPASRKLSANKLTISEGDPISIDGATGEVILGHLNTTAPVLKDMEEAQSLLAWADEFRTLGVWAQC